MLQGFSISIGACKIVPVSPKAALILVMWMYGAVPGQTYSDYATAYQQAGGNVAQAEACFKHWTP